MNGHRTSRSDAPLRAFGDALRGRQARRRRNRRLLVAGIASGMLAGLVLATLVADPMPRIVWNASRSAPLGAYVVSPGARFHTNDMVVARMPPEWRWLANERGYLPERVPLIKRVAASEGQTVCATANRISIDGREVAERLAVDSRHRPMPWWNGCRVLGPGQVFLLMREHPRSFDGRYFGVSERTEIIGPARHLVLTSGWGGPRR